MMVTHRNFRGEPRCGARFDSHIDKLADDDSEVSCGWCQRGDGKVEAMLANAVSAFLPDNTVPPVAQWNLASQALVISKEAAEKGHNPDDVRMVMSTALALHQVYLDGGEEGVGRALGAAAEKFKQLQEGRS